MHSVPVNISLDKQKNQEDGTKLYAVVQDAHITQNTYNAWWCNLFFLNWSSNIPWILIRLFDCHGNNIFRMLSIQILIFLSQVHCLPCLSKNCSVLCRVCFVFIWTVSPTISLPGTQSNKSFLKHLWKFAVLDKCYYLPFTLFSKELVNTFKEHRWQMLTSLHHASLLPINVLSHLINFDPEEDISSFAYFKDFNAWSFAWIKKLTGSFKIF